MSGTDLRIKSFQVTDDLSQRAASAKVVIAPADEFTPPPVEFSGDGTLAALSGLTIRPNGITLTLLSSYDNVPSHVLFKGLLEFMDDPKDANSDVFTLQLSAMPIKQPHRIPVTQVFNSFYTDNSNATTSHDILKSICKTAGLAIGRNDMPEYTIEGTWEVIHSTAVEEANRLVNPFNLFEFQHFYVRTDADGLQIIKVDFSKAPTGNVYSLQNIINVKRHFELYMPEKRLGDLAVMLVGADIYSYTSNEIRPPESGGPTTHPATPHDGLTPQGDNVIQFKETLTSVASTQNSVDFSLFETWAETTTEMEVTYEVVGQNLNIFAFDEFGHLVHVYEYAIGTFDQVLNDSLQDPLTTISFFNGTDTLFWTVKITGLRVVDTKVLSKQENHYDTINGLIKSDKTTYEYVDAPAAVIATGSQFNSTLPAQRLLIKETTEHTEYPGGFSMLLHVTVITHNYGNRRELIGTSTHNYTCYREAVISSDTTIEVPDSFGITNAQIQAFLAGRGPNPIPTPTFPDNSAIPPHPDPFPAANHQVTINNNKETIGQYQLLNGEIVPIYPTLKLYQILDLAKVDFEHSIAFHISCPGMNYTGLTAIWQLCLEQQNLEHHNAYWEIVQTTVPIDSVPVVGAAVNAAGTIGYVTAIEHVGDSNEALSLVTVRRLHIG